MWFHHLSNFNGICTPFHYFTMNILKSNEFTMFLNEANAQTRRQVVAASSVVVSVGGDLGFSMFFLGGFGWIIWELYRFYRDVLYGNKPT